MLPVALSVQLFTFYHNRVHVATSNVSNLLFNKIHRISLKIECLGGSQKCLGAIICSLAPPSPTISRPFTQYIFVFCFSTRFEVPNRRPPIAIPSLTYLLTYPLTYLLTYALIYALAYYCAFVSLSSR